MNNKEDTVSPIKLFHKVALEVKAYNCIVCGKRAGNENLRTPGQKGLATFVSALQIRGECRYFSTFFNVCEKVMIQDNNFSY